MSPLVSVVIPTILRKSLLNAVRSARGQETVSVQLVVVVDRYSGEPDWDNLKRDLGLGHNDLLILRAPEDDRSARQLGVDSSTAPYIAFLDDDDEWDSKKLEQQLRHAKELEAHGITRFVIGTRIVYGGRESTGKSIPRHTILPGQRVEDYLFRRRLPSITRASLYTSTLFTDRETALTVRWDRSLRRHQDWDWICRAQAAGARISQLDDPSTIITLGSESSISASPDWASSLEWAVRVGAVWNRATLSDFLMAQPMRYAIQARSLRGMAQVITAIAKTRRLPSLPAMIVGLAGLMRREFVEKAMRRAA